MRSSRLSIHAFVLLCVVPSSNDSHLGPMELIQQKRHNLLKEVCDKHPELKNIPSQRFFSIIAGEYCGIFRGKVHISLVNVFSVFPLLTFHKRKLTKLIGSPVPYLCGCAWMLTVGSRKSCTEFNILSISSLSSQLSLFCDSPQTAIFPFMDKCDSFLFNKQSKFSPGDF